MARRKKRKKTSTVRKKTTRRKTTKGRRKKNKKKWLEGVIKRADHVVGTSNKDRDEDRQARAPGKRRSRSGKIYYEYRANRADMTPFGL